MLQFDAETFKVVSDEEARERRWQGIICRRDIDSSTQAHALAANVSIAMKAHYIAVDNGENHYPRYDVILAPKVGDDVSHAFNGDSYPDGKIVSISKTMKLIVTDSGKKYYRVRETGSWMHNKTWSLVSGHHNDRNPHF